VTHLNPPPHFPPVPPAPRRKRFLWPLIGVAVALFLCCSGVALVAAMGEPTASPSSSGSISSNAAPATTASGAAKAAPATAKAAPPTIEDGVWTVGVDVPPGTYRVTANVGSEGVCYWAITKSGTNGSNIIENGIPSGGRPTVVLKKGQDFETNGCGTWQRVK
jgi:hypothetical protein